MDNSKIYSLINSAFPKANSGKKTIGKKIKPIEKTIFLPKNLETSNADKICPIGIIK